MVNKNTYQQVVNQLHNVYQYESQYVITSQLINYFMPLTICFPCIDQKPTWLTQTYIKSRIPAEYLVKERFPWAYNPD